MDTEVVYLETFSPKWLCRIIFSQFLLPSTFWFIHAKTTHLPVPLVSFPSVSCVCLKNCGYQITPKHTEEHPSNLTKEKVNLQCANLLNLKAWKSQIYLLILLSHFQHQIHWQVLLNILSNLFWIYLLLSIYTTTILVQATITATLDTTGCPRWSSCFLLCPFTVLFHTVVRILLWQSKFNYAMFLCKTLHWFFIILNYPIQAPCHDL